MNQKTRALATLLGLLALSAGAGGFAYFGVYQKQEAEKTGKEKREKIFDFDKTKVKGVSVTAKGGTTLIQQVGKEGWDVVSPTTALADKPTVDALVNQLTQLKSKAVVEEKAKDLAKYGLEKPAIKVVLRMDGGAPDVILRVGSDNSFDNSVYVATGESSDVIQAEGNFKWAVDKDLFELRDKRVLPFDEPAVKSFDVRLDANSYSLGKANGKWSLTSPTRGPADEATANKVLGALRNMKASRYASDQHNPADDAKYGLDHPRLEATLQIEDGTKLQLAMGQVDEGGVKKSYTRLLSTHAVAEVNDTVFTDANVTPFDLKDKTILAFEKDKVYGVKLSLGDQGVTLERPKTVPSGGATDDWNVTAPSKSPAKKWKVNSMLWTLSSLKAVAFADENAEDLAKYGLDKPARALTFSDKDDKEIGSLLFGKDVNSNVYVMAKGTRRVFEVEKAKLGDLPNAPADVIEAPAAPTPDAKAAAIPAPPAP